VDEYNAMNVMTEAMMPNLQQITLRGLDRPWAQYIDGEDPNESHAARLELPTGYHTISK
jgi:hypothetical protein